MPVIAEGRGLVDDVGASLVDGAGNHLLDDGVSGWVLSASAALFGTAVAVDDVGAVLLDDNGDVLAIDVSAYGDVSAGASAGGVLLEAIASLIAGVPSGAVVSVPVRRFGGWVQTHERPPQPRIHKAAEPKGKTLRCKASLLPGHVIAAALEPGFATAGAMAGGAIVSFRSVAIIKGSVSAERNFSDDEMMMLFAEAA